MADHYHQDSTLFRQIFGDREERTNKKKNKNPYSHKSQSQVIHSRIRGKEWKIFLPYLEAVKSYIYKNSRTGVDQRRAQDLHTVALPQLWPLCFLLTCEASIQVDDERAISPVVGCQQIEEAQEPNLGRAKARQNSSTPAFISPNLAPASGTGFRSVLALPKPQTAPKGMYEVNGESPGV